MILLFKASVILFVLLVFYKLVLERESFFASNRVYLLACLIFAISLPFIPLPKLVNNQGYVTNIIDSRLFGESNDQEDTFLIDATESNSNEVLTTNSIKKASDKKSGTKAIVEPPIEESNIEVSIPKENSNTNWLLLFYLFGVIVLGINLLAQVVSTFRKAWKAKDKIEDEGHIIVNLEGEVEPCSFFNYIFINPTLYDYDTYEQILAHEKIHVDMKHTLDLILSELAVIAFWFNPFVWILRKEIEKNIEYQTDALLLNTDQKIKKSYQLNLVDIASKTRPLAITTNYNQSLIKQRILKMNGKRSHKFNYWKYAFLLPLLFILVLGLNKPNELSAMDLPIEELSVIEEEIPTIIDTKNIPNEEEDKDAMSDDLPPSKSKEESTKQDKLPTRKNIPEFIIPEKQEIEYVDCKEFEEAVAKGNLKSVKEILKTLDPECLTVAKEILEEKRDKSEAESPPNEKKEIPSEKEEVCEKLEKAINNRDVNKTRQILMNEDFGCLKDVYGDPTQDEKLIKGLLKYGAKLSIDEEKIVHIDDVGFKIDIPEMDDPCQDANYLEIVKAIKVADRQKIRNILSNRDLTCPLGKDGITNDFPFIKEMMKYHPEILIVNRVSVTVYGVGVLIDINAFKDDEDEIERDLNFKYNQALAELDRIMEEGYKYNEEPGCLSLLNAIDKGDRSTAVSILETHSTDCYHKVSETHSSPTGSRTTSHTLTPLILACANGDLSMAELLIDNDADANYRGDGYETALVFAVRSSNLQIVKLLVNEGANLNYSDDQGYTALDYAEGYGFLEIEAYLKAEGGKSGISNTR